MIQLNQDEIFIYIERSQVILIPTKYIVLHSLNIAFVSINSEDADEIPLSVCHLIWVFIVCLLPAYGYSSDRLQIKSYCSIAPQMKHSFRF